jgi:TetR/AcrR family tetracycline transcriptional repressor
MTVDAPAPKLGRPPRISLDTIIAAASAIARESSLDDITMAGVAGRLSVKRSALNYHVRNRAQLLELVAPLVIDFDLGTDWLDPDQAWQQGLAAFGRELRRVLLLQPRMASYFRMPLANLHSLKQLDALGQAIVDAGFSRTDASRAIRLVAQIAFISVRDQLAYDDGVHPQERELGATLQQLPAEQLPNIRSYLAVLRDHDEDAQFEFDVDCAIAGIEAIRSSPAKIRRNKSASVTTSTTPKRSPRAR